MYYIGKYLKWVWFIDRIRYQLHQVNFWWHVSANFSLIFHIISTFITERISLTGMCTFTCVMISNYQLLFMKGLLGEKRLWIKILNTPATNSGGFWYKILSLIHISYKNLNFKQCYLSIALFKFNWLLNTWNFHG